MADPFSPWPRDLRAEIARNIISRLRAYAPVELCDQAEQDIIDCLPRTAAPFGRKSAESEVSPTPIQLALFGSHRS